MTQVGTDEEMTMRVGVVYDWIYQGFFSVRRAKGEIGMVKDVE